MCNYIGEAVIGGTDKDAGVGSSKNLAAKASAAQRLSRDLKQVALLWVHLSGLAW